MPPFWSDLARTTRHAVPLLVGCGALQVAAVAALPRDLDFGTTLALLPAVNYVLYRIALFDLRAPYLSGFVPDAPPQAPVRFLLAMTLYLFLSLGAFVALHRIIQPETGMGIQLTNLAFLGLIWLALSKFGTLLPAAAAARPLWPGAALRAAEGRWMGVAIDLFLVAGLGGAAILVAAFLGKARLEGLQAAPPLHYTVDTLLTALAWASLIPTVVVLTRAYWRAWSQGAAKPS